MLPGSSILPYPLGQWAAAPQLASASSVNGWGVEVTFSEGMKQNETLLNTSSYLITPTTGAQTSVNAVRVGTVVGPTVMSVILGHTGTTLGGNYRVSANGPTSESTGMPIGPETASFLAMGEPPAYSVGGSALGGFVLTFDHPLHSNPSVSDLVSYQVVCNDDYPITPTLTGATFPYEDDFRKVWLSAYGVTTLHYTGSVGANAVAFRYNGTYLPNSGTTFSGSEYGTGTSSIVDGSLRINVVAGNSYGWLFTDTSGKVTTGTTFRTDVSFDAATGTYVPAIAAVGDFVFAQTIIHDTVSEILVQFQRVGGVEQIQVVSGAYNTTTNFTWSDGPHKLSVIRNILANLYAILVDDQPIQSSSIASFTGVSADPSSVRFNLLSTLTVTNFKVSAVNFTASTTVYSAAWNFLHDWEVVFQGSNNLTRDFILTNRGPLVKDWGDMTPAAKNDVGVTINGAAVVVSDVNPHIGKITLAVPVPLLPPGDPQLDVWVDYKWMATPIMVMSGLNEHGQVLNKWDRLLTGHHSSTITPGLGAPDIARFPYCIVLGPMDTPEPILIGHRYMGFEKAYSALLNSSTTLVLNANPHQYDSPGFDQVPQGSTAAYEATTTPQMATPSWELVGIDNGFVVGDGTYQVIDRNIGSYAATPPCTMFKKDMDMGFPASMVLVSRYLVNPPPYDGYSAATSYLPGDKVLVGTNLYLCTAVTHGKDPSNTDFWSVVASTSVGIMADAADGVFVGVGFGFHQNKRLYLVGNLLVNGVQHVGLLKDARNPHLLASWDVGPTTKGTIASQTTVTFVAFTSPGVPNESYPSSFVVGNRFQILAPHTQAGVYTATHIVPQSDGAVTVTVTPAFSVDFTKWGNKYPDVIFETPWLAKPTTYRLMMYPSATSTTALNIKLALSGETSGAKVLEGDAFGTDLPQVATSSLALFMDQANPDKKIGTTVWGSLSYAARNDTKWSFLRYGIIPNATAYHGHEKTSNTSMTVLPENEADPSWFQTKAFGLSEASRSLLMKATSGNDTLDTTFAYGRDEPFFKKDSNLDLTARFKVETGVLGAGDVELVLNDKVREARIATLSYYEDIILTPYRQLVRMPNVSFAGLVHPTLQGWVTAQASDDAATNHENDVVFDLTANSSQYMQNLAMLSLVPPDGGERIIEGQFAVDAAFVPGADGKTGIYIAGDFGTTATGGVAVTVWMNGGTPTVSLANPTGLAPVKDYPFDWTDGLQHTYRVVVSGGVVSLFVDDVIQTPTKAIGDFAGMGSTQHRCVFGAVGLAARTGQVRWRSASYSCLPRADVRQTLGVYLGGDKDDIDNWEIPRTDATTALNSAQVGPVIKDMDCTAYMTVRVLRTWDWGVTVFRPDLAPPPFFNGDWATQNMQPSAGWITVEYTKLPYVPRTMGFVGFGSFDSRSIMQSRWEYVNFRLFKPITDDWKSPQNMVLNQANVVTSGEPVLDDTLETVVIMPLADNRRVLLKPTHIYAHNVWKVVDGNTIYTRESWSFDREAQLLTLNRNANGTDVLFTGQAVTVVYYPGKPFTNTYLESQKLLDSMTLLNQGTPPVPKSQHNPDVMDVYVNGEYKAKILKTDTAGEIIPLYGPPTYESMYENMEFMEVNDGGWDNLITIAGEGFLQPGFTGWKPTEGEAVYDSKGDPVGFVGNPVGGHVIWIKGDAYWTKVEGWNDQLQTFHMIDMAGPAPVDALTFFDETLGKYWFASGGSFLNDVVDSPTGNVIDDTPAGGLLNSGVVLYPSKAVQ